MIRGSVALLAVLSFVVPPAACAAEPPAGCEAATLWTRRCSPSASGTAPLEGTVRGTLSSPASNIAIMYRTTEGSLGPEAGGAQHGSWNSAKTDEAGAFRLLLPACADQESCVGGAYEVYIAYKDEPCSEMWYAKMIVGQPDHLPSAAVTCDRILPDIRPLTGNGGFEPGCKPYWAQNCMPGTAGTSTVRGSVTQAQGDQPFSFSHVSLAYRTVEKARNGLYAYGPTHYVTVDHKGAFMATIGACGAVSATFGCDGGLIEAWPAYDRKQCGEPQLRTSTLVAGSQAWGTSICDTRGTLNLKLHATDASHWRVIVKRHGHSTIHDAPGSNGNVSVRLTPGNYRLLATKNRMRCVYPRPVRIPIATVIHVRMHCGRHPPSTRAAHRRG